MRTRIKGLLISALFAALAFMLIMGISAGKASAAACTCTINAVSKTALSDYHVLNCSTSGTACTVTDPHLANGGSNAHHIEIENDCAAVVTVCPNGDTAVLHKCWDIQANAIKLYDILNGPQAAAPPGTAGTWGSVPPGPFSVISSGSQSACLNFTQW